jgi:hypothetical protein
MTDLYKEPLEKLHQIVRLLMPNTPMHIAVMREIEQRNKHGILVHRIINSVISILCALTLIVAIFLLDFQ